MRRWVWVLLLFGCGGAPTDHGRALQAAQDEARAAAATRAPVRPIMVFTATEAHFIRADGKETVSLADPQVDLLITIALLPRLGWWVATDRATIDARTAVALAKHAKRVGALRANLSQIDGPARDRAAALLEQVQRELDALSRKGKIEPGRLGAFVQRHRALSDQLLRDAATRRIKRLQTVVSTWWARLDAAGRATLRTVVIDTAARREGHATVQYLMRALGAFGEGERIQYQEGGTVEAAVATVERRADATALGTAGYGDMLHLQQDALAPGARQVLEDARFKLKR